MATGAEPGGAIDLAGIDLGNASEVIRAFLPRSGEQEIPGIYIDPPEDLEPFGFGLLLADLVHHGAKAYAYKFGMDEARVRYEISKGLASELAFPTETAKQIFPETNG